MVCVVFETYTCSDFDLPSITGSEKQYWHCNGFSHEVEILHDRPASQVHLIGNFITLEQCKAVEDAAKPIFHTATIADGKGGSEVSPNRKAMQAGIKIP